MSLLPFPESGMRARSGFTLVEMMIVVVLIAIISAFSLPRIDYTKMRLDSGARSVRAALQQAQSRAVAQQHNVDAVFDQAHSRIVFFDDYKQDMAMDSAGEHEWVAPLNDGVVFANPATSLTGGEAPTNGLAGATLTTATYQTAVLPAFVFRPDGAVSSDIQIYIKSMRGRTTDWRAIYVWQATGRPDWYQMETGGTWQQNGF
jgi:prepilin-type N-terminal cleavage/methylation domain-containing protein